MNKNNNNFKFILFLVVFFIIICSNIVLSETQTKTAERQYMAYKYLPNNYYYCGFNLCNLLRDSSTHTARVYQRYDFSDVNETITKAYVTFRKNPNSESQTDDIQGRFYYDGIWSQLNWNTMYSEVSGSSVLLFSKQPNTFPLNVYQNQTYDISSLINEDPDKLFTILYNWETENMVGYTYNFYMSAYISYEILDPNCVRNWTCTNWSLCQETGVKECNQAFDQNECGFEYDGDYSEFGYPSCCYEDWYPMYGSCNENDTQLKYYYDIRSCNTFEHVPEDNGTYVTCNLCNPDLELIEEKCIYNGTSYYTTTYYVDNNYYSCCAITESMDDCIIDYYPYNEVNTTLCVDTINDFELQIDENVFLTSYARDDKVFATIWMNNTEQIYTCQSYVKTLDGYGIKDKRVIQVNPIYQPKQKSFLSLDSRKYEDREFFVTNKGQATVYYTDENIVVDGRPYLFGVECVSNQTTEKLVSEKVAYIRYSFINEPTTRLFWVKENMWSIVYTAIILAIVFILLGIFKRNLKGWF